MDKYMEDECDQWKNADTASESDRGWKIGPRKPRFLKT